MRALSKISLIGVGICAVAFLVGLLRVNGNLQVPVSGTITVDGRPLRGAQVIVLADRIKASPVTNDDKHSSVVTTTDENGEFRLANGIAPGDYRIVVRGVISDDPADLIPDLGSDGVDGEQLRAAMRTRTASHRSVPQRFSSPEHTVLGLHVPDCGTSQANFHLTTETQLAGSASSDQSR